MYIEKMSIATILQHLNMEFHLVQIREKFSNEMNDMRL